MPFNIFTMCHQFKVRFALSFNKQDTSSGDSQDQGIVHAFIGIRYWQGSCITDVKIEISGRNMRNFGTPDGAFERLYPTRFVVPSPQPMSRTHQHQVAFSKNTYPQQQQSLWKLKGDVRDFLKKTWKSPKTEISLGSDIVM